MTDYVPMTRAAYDRKMVEVKRMENEEMPRIAEMIAAARDEGDLKENAEYHAQRESQGMLQAKINQLKGELSRASIVDTSKLPKDEIVFGATVVVLDTDLNEKEEITLVGSGDEDYDAGKFLITSPIGRGLLGKKKGDKAAIEVPSGMINFEILDVRFDDA